MSTPKIPFTCPHCGRALKVGAGLVGKVIRCPNTDCGQSVRVPGDLTPDPPRRAGVGFREIAAWSLCGILALLLLAAVLVGGSRKPSGSDNSAGPDEWAALDERANRLTTRNEELTRLQEGWKREKATLTQELDRLRKEVLPAKEASRAPATPPPEEQSPEAPVTNPKEALQKAQAELSGPRDSLRVYEREVAALKKRPKGTGKTFTSVQQLLEGLPEKARPPFGADDDRRLVANEWLVKNVVGSRLELKRELGTVYVPPVSGKWVPVSVITYRDRYVSANLFGIPHYIHLGSDAPYGFNLVCNTPSDVKKLKGMEQQIVTVGGRIESVRFDREEGRDYFQFYFSAVSLDSFNPMPGSLDGLEQARSESQKALQVIEDKVKRLEKLVKEAGG